MTTLAPRLPSFMEYQPPASVAGIPAVDFQIQSDDSLIVRAIALVKHYGWTPWKAADFFGLGRDVVLAVMNSPNCPEIPQRMRPLDDWDELFVPFKEAVLDKEPLLARAFTGERINQVRLFLRDHDPNGQQEAFGNFEVARHYLINCAAYDALHSPKTVNAGVPGEAIVFSSPPLPSVKTSDEAARSLSTEEVHSLSTMTLRQLRSMGRECRVPRYSRLSKAELTAALAQDTL